MPQIYHRYTGAPLVSLELLQGANLSLRELGGADLSYANLVCTNLRGSALTLASLYRATAAGAYLDGADLWRADARHAALILGDLSFAHLDLADCRGATFQGANLQGARLRGTDLRGAILNGADFRGAHFRTCLLDGATYDQNTRWPEGFDPGRHPLVFVPGRLRPPAPGLWMPGGRSLRGGPDPNPEFRCLARILAGGLVGRSEVTEAGNLTARSGGAMATVLLVDDNRDVRETLADILTYEGYSLLEASNGQEALALLRSTATRPDLIILDLVMPVMSGPEFLTELRANGEWAEIPIIVCSGTVDERTIVNLAPDAAWLRKPIDVTHLLDLLSTVAKDAGDPAVHTLLGRQW